MLHYVGQFCLCIEVFIHNSPEDLTNWPLPFEMFCCAPWMAVTDARANCDNPRIAGTGGEEGDVRGDQSGLGT